MEVKPGYKQTEVGVIPEEWEVKPLGKLRIRQLCRGCRLLKHDTRALDGLIPWTYHRRAHLTQILLKHKVLPNPNGSSMIDNILVRELVSDRKLLKYGCQHSGSVALTGTATVANRP